MARPGTLLIALLMALSAVVLSAQEESPPHPLGAADTSSPRATLETFLRGVDEVYRRFRGEGRSFSSEAERRAAAGRILRCLDLSQVPASVSQSVGAETAAYLKEVLDRIELPPVEEWPDAEQVASLQLTRWAIPNTEITIAQVKDGQREASF